MRNILLCATFMLLSLVAHAQQALWGSPSLLSPEIHPDNTVTFRSNIPMMQAMMRPVKVIGGVSAKLPGSPIY